MRPLHTGFFEFMQKTHGKDWSVSQPKEQILQSQRAFMAGARTAMAELAKVQGRSHFVRVQKDLEDEADVSP